MSAHNAELKTAMQALEKKFQQRMQQRILEQLELNRHPQSARTIAVALSVRPTPVERALADLLDAGEVSQVGTDASNHPTFRPVEIGPCEWCGVVSHHLVAGECPQHRASVLNSPKTSAK